MLNVSLTVRSNWQEKLQHLETILTGMDAVLIAFSGGIDSTLLAFIANKNLGNRALIVFANSPVVPLQELLNARAIASELKFNYAELTHNQLEIIDFVCNTKDRCYYCKLDLHKQLKSLAASKNINIICEGSNYDDISDYRPGLKAVAEVGIRSPLAESFLTKKEIRSIAKQLGLRNWDKPATPCLSSRIPYGIKVTKETIEKIDKCETFLKGLGIKEVRLRHHNDIARIEVGESDLALVTSGKSRKEITDFVKNLGYTYVTIDLQGFRSGSLNEILGQEKATN
jgi:pyridinium-3,5-biscarboxylic acid mononucleotide sulfurtransferase